MSRLKKLLLTTAGIVTIVGPLIVGLVNAPPTRAQSQTQQQPVNASLAFDVASIKPMPRYQGGPLRVSPGIEANGINFQNVTLKLCLTRAYGVRPFQVTGPAWINEERYAIVAKAAGPAKESELMLMLRKLLADRFKLAFHRESKEMPVYALVVAKGGPKMKESKEEGDTEIGGGDGPGLVAQRASMALLTGVVTRQVDIPVIDETGLNGRYDFKLIWSHEEFRQRPNAAATGDAPATRDPAGTPSIFTALQEQLGLKLQAKRAPVEILVIDHVERPSEN